MAKRGRPRYPDILTPREWEVLALLREELSNEEIADRLDITERTAKYHVSEILGKLGVGSRQEAAAWEPDRRPWWMAAGAPIAFVSRRFNFGWLSPVTAGIAAIVVAAGVGLLVWGLLQTRGGEGADAGAASPTDAPVSADAFSTDGLPTTYLRVSAGLRPIDPASGQDLPGYDFVPVQQSRGPAAISPDGRTAAIALDRLLELIDLEHKKPAQTLDLPGTVNEMLWSPDGKRLYLRTDDDCAPAAESTAQQCDSMIVTVDVPSLSILFRTALPAGHLHWPFRLSPTSSFAPALDGRRVYLFGNSVANPATARLVMLDLETGAVREELELPEVLWAAARDETGQPGDGVPDHFPAFVVGSDGRHAYVVHADSDTVTAIDLEAMQLVRSSDLRPRASLFERFLSSSAGEAHADGRWPYAEKWAAISADGRYLYVGGGSAIPQGESLGVGIYPNESAGLRVIDTDSLEIVAEIEPGGECAYRSLAIHPAGNYLYALTYGTDPGQTGIPQCYRQGLLVLDARTLEVTGTRPDGSAVLVAAAE